MNSDKLQINSDFTFDKFYDYYIRKYLPQYFMFFPSHGYIVWRFGSGENVELLHIRAFKTGEGIGPRLVKCMLRELQRMPPYHSIFGMTLASNKPAINMYRSLGFNTIECPFPYKGGNSIVFYQQFDVLCEKLLVDDAGDEELLQNVIKSGGI